MPRRHDIDRLLREWPYEPGDVIARLVKAADGRQVLQMRVEMGVLQLEVDGRPDGAQPQGFSTYYDYLRSLVDEESGEFELDSAQCAEADREFLQYYHRRICWLCLREYDRAVRDADHTLALMDLARDHSPDEQWTLSHEQYRPFVVFHRTQASALVALENDGPEAALDELSKGLATFRGLFEQYEAEEQFDDDELVQRLCEMQDALRKQYNLKPSLSEQLAEAVASEQYELAARIRDEISRRGRE